MLIPCDSKCLGRVHSVTRNKTERNSPKERSFTEKLTPSFLECFIVPKLFGMDFQVFYVLRIVSEQNSKAFSLPKMEFLCFSHQKMVRNGILRVFSSAKRIEMEFQGFSFPRNRRNSDVTAVCSISLCMPRNFFFFEK
jgi:hypothetical protein